MTRTRQQHGFSLTETLMAVGTLAIGLSFIAGTFLTGVFFSTVSTERTIAAVAAEEAFAKAQLYGLDSASPILKSSGSTAYEILAPLPSDESRYPSIRAAAPRQYSWSMICRRPNDANDPNALPYDDELVQCTVFVSRETGGNPSYWTRPGGAGATPLVSSTLPRPVPVNIYRDAAGMYRDEEIAIRDAVSGDAPDERAFVCEGSIIVDDATGDIYRVLKRDELQPERVLLDRTWTGGDLTATAGGWVWVVPPAASGGRNPGVAVYQKIIRFPRP